MPPVVVSEKNYKIWSPDHNFVSNAGALPREYSLGTLINIAPNKDFKI